MRQEIAQYIISLAQAANKTQQAEDRQIYRILLADSAVLLALVNTGATKELVVEAITRHDRLWGQMWPVDDVCVAAISEWQKVKDLI